MFRLSIYGIAIGVIFVSTSTGRAQTPSVSPMTAAINELIAAKWKEAEIKQPAKRATDHEFIRRVFIDLIGRIPYPEEVLDYEQDRSPDKRIKLVKRLLYSDNYKPKIGGQFVPKPGGGRNEFVSFDYTAEYARHWSNIWTVWLMTRSSHSLYREQMRYWLERQFEKNVPYRDLVVDLITATGATNENGAVNFVIHHIGESIPQDKRAELGRFDGVPITSRVTRLFLGLQTQCIQCHDHPFNKEWVQSDFWGVNAFFRQTTRDRSPTPNNGNRQITDNPVQVTLSDDPSLNSSGIVFYERRDGKLMAAKPNFLKDYAQAMAGELPNKTLTSLSNSRGKTRRQILAEYIITHDNFAKAYVNRIWAHLFGRGLNKEPSFDDFGSHNEVVHPELLDKLASEFFNVGFDSKMLLEWICSSDVYNLSHEANPAYADPQYNPYFARMPLKAMSPEVLFESLMVATRAELLGSGNERIEQARENWLRKLVQNFGDDEGNELSFNGTVIQALLMLNGSELNSEINRGAGKDPKEMGIVRAIAAKHTDRRGMTNAAKVIDELFLAALARHPSKVELDTLLELQMKGRKVSVEVSVPPTAQPRPAGNQKPQPGRPNRPATAPAPAPAPTTATVPGWITPAGPNDLGFYQDLFWALLNTNEFILNH